MALCNSDSRQNTKAAYSAWSPYALVKIEILGEQGDCTYIYRHERKLAYPGYADLISLTANYTSTSRTPSQNRAFMTA
jgi:hypothetical protein